MKRAAAFLLSLTVIWLQMLASAQTLSPGTAKPECGCCTQKAVCRCCCVAPVTPDAKPLPATPVVTGTTLDLTAIVPRLLAWTLPATAPAIVSSAESSSHSLSAVPLFQRNCALLI